MVPITSLFQKSDINNAVSALSDEEYFKSSEYLKMSAKDKQAKIMEKVTQAKGSVSKWPGWRMGEVFLLDIGPTFDTMGDIIPKAPWWPYPKRKKYIHSVGVQGKVKLVPSGQAHPFTGIFKGADYGIVRLSLAALPKLNEEMPFTTGLGLKFLRDGVDSANLVAMFGVDGTPGDWNYFSPSYNFSNHILSPNRPELKLL